MNTVLSQKNLLSLIFVKVGRRDAYHTCALVCKQWHDLVWNHPSTGLFFHCFRHFRRTGTHTGIAGVSMQAVHLAAFFYNWMYPERQFKSISQPTPSHGIPVIFASAKLRRALKLHNCKRAHDAVDGPFAMETYHAQHLVTNEERTIIMTAAQYAYASGGEGEDHEEWVVRSVEQAQRHKHGNYLFAAMYQLMRRMALERARSDETCLRLEMLANVIRDLLKYRKIIALSELHKVFEHHPDYEEVLAHFTRHFLHAESKTLRWDQRQ